MAAVRSVNAPRSAAVTALHVLLAALLVVAFVGCKKKAGASCSTDREAECTSSITAMTCISGTWRELSCRGPKGCGTQASLVDCDQTLAMAGDSCETEDNFACAVDQKSTLRCEKTRWVMAHACPKSCAVKDRVVDCD